MYLFRIILPSFKIVQQTFINIIAYFDVYCYTSNFKKILAISIYVYIIYIHNKLFQIQ